MKVLWLTNVTLPEASELMGQTPGCYGGWLVNTAKNLEETKDIRLAAISIKQGVKETIKLDGQHTTHYVVPAVDINDKSAISDNRFLAQIVDKEQPDIVHIFGTEFAHTLAMANVCNAMDIKMVITIQGLVSICAKHYLSGLPTNILSKATLRDLLRRDNLRQQQKKFEQRGRLEVEAIKKTKHVIGRTTWDKACVSWINSEAEYHFCNETLRDAFYENTWTLEGCEKHTIMTSQGSYPIKGLHFMLEAMPLILKKYPDTVLYIAGDNPTKSGSISQKLRQSSYGKYLIELINKYQLHNSVRFTGPLNEQEMCDRYVKSNVFVCPSSIENSPNSLGEAMILGMPCVASDVGGVPDMMVHREEGFLYQVDAPYMLAYYVCEIFADDDLAKKLSSNAKRHAKKTHDRKANKISLIDIYNRIPYNGI